MVNSSFHPRVTKGSRMPSSVLHALLWVEEADKDGMAQTVVLESGELN